MYKVPRLLIMTSDTQQPSESLWMQMPFQYLHFIEDGRLREADGLGLARLEPELRVPYSSPPTQHSPSNRPR